MHPFDNRYTHHFKRGSESSLSRLDYCFTSPAFLTSVTNSEIGYSYLSDHSPVCLNFALQNDEVKGKGYWKFPDFLLSDKTFTAGLQVRIPRFIKENPNVDPNLLWDAVKCDIRTYAIEYLSANKRERKELIESVEQQISEATLLRDSMTHDPYKSRFYADKVASLQTKLDDTYLQINRSKNQVLQAQIHYESNRCTKFYFAQRGKKNDDIKCLYNKQGERVFKSKEILHECKEFYENLYKQPHVFENNDLSRRFLSKVPRTVLTDQGSAALGAEITTEELQEALKDMKRHSVPGLDGLTVGFYITFWNLIKDLLFASYSHAFKVRKLSLSQRRGIIHLIPKQNQNPLFVSAWRPISLLSVDYKILN